MNTAADTYRTARIDGHPVQFLATALFLATAARLYGEAAVRRHQPAILRACNPR